jgi:hypothetical protein
MSERGPHRVGPWGPVEHAPIPTLSSSAGDRTIPVRDGAQSHRY